MTQTRAYILCGLALCYLTSCAAESEFGDPAYQCLVCGRLRGVATDKGSSTEPTTETERWYLDQVAEGHDHTWVPVRHGFRDGTFTLALLYKRAKSPYLPPNEKLGIRIARALARASAEEREQARQELISETNFWEIPSRQDWSAEWDRWLSTRPTWSELLRG